MIPLALYIHMPWCVRKCPYCDFNSHTLQGPLLEEDYIAALIEDLQQEYAFVENRKLTSIFIGGGTPSLFKAAHYARLFEVIAKMFHWDPALEVTLEANPGTLDHQKFKQYRAIGINRLSLGVQSFQNDKLKKLGRIHDAEQTTAAICSAKEAGFENINLDLMYGLPEQSHEDALYDIERALSFDVPHLSWYQLTLEPNTVFYKKPPVLPEEDLLWEMEELCKNKISSYYTQYEVSAYSKKGFACQHNMNYWHFGDYLGIGAGAHGKITREGQIFRRQKVRQPKTYLDPAQSFLAKSTHLSKKDRVFEFMLNSLRLWEPVTWQLLFERTGLKIHDLKMPLQQAETQGLLLVSEDGFETTALGRRHLNTLQALFLT